MSGEHHPKCEIIKGRCNNKQPTIKNAKKVSSIKLTLTSITLLQHLHKLLSIVVILSKPKLCVSLVKVGYAVCGKGSRRSCGKM